VSRARREVYARLELPLDDDDELQPAEAVTLEGEAPQWMDEDDD
jgi:hypothetical protein